ncbi:MAG: GNAT family N-acetyltransferase [Archangium sp.]
MKIRFSTRDDVPALMRLERDAATRFVAVGLPGAVDLPCLPESAFVDGQVFVALVQDVIAGFALVSMDGDDLHLDELDVSSTHGGRGIGRELLNAVVGFALSQKRRRVTLTTFRDVPFNAPFYARVGFVEVKDDARLEKILQHERERGIDIAPRVAMAFTLPV